MKTPEKSSPVMEFVFQTIKLDQVSNLIPHTYRSKYQVIRNQVIEKIKTMPGDETFMFQPLDKKTKLDDNLIARICHGINTALVSENMNWKISFSEKAKAFVVAPFKRYKLGKRGEYKMTKAAIAASRQAKPKPTTQASHIVVTDQEAEQMTHLLKITHKQFGKTLKELQVKVPGNHNPELADLKKAILYVGRNAMGIKLANLGRMLGLSSASTTTLCHAATKDEQAKEFVKVLTSAISQNGGGN